MISYVFMTSAILVLSNIPPFRSSSFPALPAQASSPVSTLTQPAALCSVLRVLEAGRVPALKFLSVTRSRLPMDELLGEEEVPRMQLNARSSNQNSSLFLFEALDQMFWCGSCLHTYLVRIIDHNLIATEKMAEFHLRDHNASHLTFQWKPDLGEQYL